ncbi:MAG: Na/Pi cotransporter family protein [Clostridiales bacterium]|nr:Na/Pi cotransporter family protein [Clostridiales bacterium]MCF8023422.1 Na/Pi cotransporter family protein [Clostridiales bacterium]
MIDYKIIFSMIGGMGLLLYGMYVMSEGLQKIAGHKLRKLLSSLTKNRIISLVTGAIITVLFQSSTATTVILVGLTSASIISLKQTLGIILGADIGTTVTAQLIALKITEIALPIVGIGATIIFFSKRDKYKYIGQTLMGFGLLFLGLQIMSEGMSPLKEAPFFQNFLLNICENPFLAISLAAIFTFLVHSSAATISIIILLAMQGMVNLIPSIYLLYGANIGTSFTALISSLGSSREAQRVAAAHFLFKLSGVLIFLPFTVPFANIIRSLTPGAAHQVANAHTIFNVLIGFLFLPFTSHFAILLEKILPDKKNGSMEPQYLDYTLIETPSLAIGLALKEVIYISDNTIKLLKDSKQAIDNYDSNLIEDMLTVENGIDQHTTETRQYLTRVLRQPLSKFEFNRCLTLINTVNELENIGDVVEKNLVYLAESKKINNSEFSEEGQQELDIFHEKLYELANIVNNIILTGDSKMVKWAVYLQDEINELEFRSRIAHIRRLSRGIIESENTSKIHLDLINAYLNISQHLIQIAQTIDEPEMLDIKHIDDFKNIYENNKNDYSGIKVLDKECNKIYHDK